jgi:hypothetical protein
MPDAAPERTQVTLRCLPNGKLQAVVATGWKGRRLQVELPVDSSAVDLAPGASVEIEAPERLHLGEVEARQGRTLTILVEHSVDRQLLDRIREVWR